MEKKVILIALLLAVALAPHGAYADATSDCLLANAGAPSWYCSQVNQATAQVWSSWEPIALIAVLLAFFAAALIFIASIVLSSEKLRKFAIGEIFEAAATALIVVAFMTLSATLFGIIPGFVTGPVDPYALSLNYISSTIQASQTPIVALYNTIMIDAYAGSQETAIVMPEDPISEIPGYLSSIGNAVAVLWSQWFIAPADTMMGLLVDGMLALTAEFYTILFFMYVAIPVFLIPGIIFRAILPLRAVGGMLIAVAISFYLVMPTLFSVAYYFINISMITNLNAAAGQIVTDSQGTLSQTNAESASSPLAFDVNALQTDMGAYFLSVLFYPALILGMTYFSMKTIADFVGGVAKFTGRLNLL